MRARIIVLLFFITTVSLLYPGATTGLVVRTPAVKEYMKNTYPTNDVVSLGGWYALETEASHKLAQENFERLKPHLHSAATATADDASSSFNVVDAGGWDTVQALAADPKGALMELIDQSLQQNNNGKATTSDEGVTMDQLDAIIALLQAEGKGFDSNLVDGDWELVLKKKGGVPKTTAKKNKKRLGFINRLLKREKLRSTSDFDVSKQEFYGTAKILKFGRLSSKVHYNPTGENYENINDHIVLRRVACDILSVSWKFWKLPKITLPFKSSGYLDFLYLDNDVRVTKGNRGGLFVHMRPSQ